MLNQHSKWMDLFQHFQSVKSIHHSSSLRTSRLSAAMKLSVKYITLISYVQLNNSKQINNRIYSQPTTSPVQSLARLEHITNLSLHTILTVTLLRRKKTIQCISTQILTL